jgi:hypothetical protein
MVTNFSSSISGGGESKILPSPLSSYFLLTLKRVVISSIVLSFALRFPTSISANSALLI